MSDVEAELRRRAIEGDREAAAVYADVLLERGDVRGELIQVQLRREGGAADAALVRREAELSRVFAPAWAEVASFRRGFLDELEVGAAVLCEEADGAPELATVRLLRLSEAVDGAELARVLALPALRRVEELAFVRCPVSPAALREVMARLRRLTLVRCLVGDAGVAALVAGEPPRALEALTLMANLIGDDGAEALARWRGLAAMRSLTLSSADIYDPHCNSIGDRGAIALAGSPFAARLERLDLGDNQRITNETMLALADAPQLASLRELRLGFTALDDEGAAALAGSPQLARLETLDVRFTGLGDAGLAALLRRPGLSTIYLTGTQITADGVRALPVVARGEPRVMLARLDLQEGLRDAVLARFGANVEFY